MSNKLVTSPKNENENRKYSQQTLTYYNNYGSITESFMDKLFDGLSMNPYHQQKITNKIDEYIDFDRNCSEDISNLFFDIPKNEFRSSIETYLYSVLNSIQKSISHKTTIYIYNLDSDKDYDVMKYEDINEWADFKFDLEPSKKLTKDTEKIVSEISAFVTDDEKDYSISRYFYIIIPEVSLGVRVPFTNICNKLYKSEFNVEKDSELLQKIIADLEKKKIFESEKSIKEQNKKHFKDLEEILKRLTDSLTEISKNNEEDKKITDMDIKRLNFELENFEYVLEQLKIKG